MSSTDETPTVTFASLGLASEVVSALTGLGYETPTPIQAAIIPHMLEGHDVLGQAQTGTGKTAAFALPILSRIDPNKRGVQAIVLAPTRELAIQVAEAFGKYGAGMRNFSVLPIYGGQSYMPQLSALRRGVQVVVGTPGRVIDHLEKGSLKLDEVSTIVLDEADEMLRMGFIDDVEAVLKKAPQQKQVALFSATMPPAIKRIADTYLTNAREVAIAAKTRTATTVRQRVWMVAGTNKLDALTRILEVESFDGMIIFARTKLATDDLAEKLSARGFSVAPLNGDIPQQLRERTVQRLKDGDLDIIVATDVAARGLDVDRITHVLNYDVPTDPESYVHRIGRTGRAGRTGDAILFLAPRERGLLNMIERATRQNISRYELPSHEAVTRSRQEKFKQKVKDVLVKKSAELDAYRELLSQLEHESETSLLDLAAALALMAHGSKTPLNSTETAAPAHDYKAPRPERSNSRFGENRGDRGERPAFRERSEGDSSRFKPSSDRPRTPFGDKPSFERPRTPFAEKPAFERPRPAATERPAFAERPASAERPAFTERPAPSERPAFEKPRREERSADRDARPRSSSEGKETYRIEVGNVHGVKPGNIVGAIANEAELDASHIGRIDIQEDHSFIDLPEGMPKHIFKLLQSVWVSGQRLNLAKVEGGAAPAPSFSKPKPRFKPRSE